MAVLPTPGSPMRTGLFFVRRREDLDDPADLVVAADDRVDLALAGPGGEVLAVLLERLELVLGVLRRDAVRAADLLEDLQHLLGADAEALVHGEQQVLDGQVVVAEVLLELLGAARRPGSARG